MFIPVLLSVLLFRHYATAQSPLIQTQNNTWNSTFTLSQSQIASANLSDSLAHNIEVVINYERTNHAGGPASEDLFYSLPPTFNPHSPPPPGTIIKLENYTNTSIYTIPPGLSVSRILYTTSTLNGTSTPASGYILWPFLPKPLTNLTSASGLPSSSSNPVYPIIAYGHGTTGQTPSCAISKSRILADTTSTEPWAMALAGYAVIAPDYAGLGLQGVPSPYFILPTHANDLFYAVQAAQSAFPTLLSKQFVIMGQSQGGGAAWAAAQRQVTKPVEGYLGTVAASPFTDVLADIAADPQTENNERVVAIAQGLGSVLPSFRVSDWVTDLGIKRLALLKEVGACNAAGSYILGGVEGEQILKEGWNSTSAAEWYRNVTLNGGKRFAGPMLVIQGTQDPNANVNVTSNSVNETCSVFPQAQLKYVQFEGVTHVSILYTGQQMWLQWIEDRFKGVQVPEGCEQEVVSPVRGVANVDRNVNWFIELDLYSYE
ncbi:MAG: hypothetical protein M1820_007952 [Bogoriella megaspora]|nr:MAG: hypothetical protein M1820_007952 [Bogoriella megaspora]